MNDFPRLGLGILGTATGITLAHVAQGAAIAASLATAVFMALSILEKVEARRVRRREAAQLRFPFAEK